jgi:hypothetical protein
MARYLVLLVLLAGPAWAQERAPTADEIAFASLPREAQALLGNLPPREALQKYDYARQNLVALGTPYPSPERLRAQIETVLAPNVVRSASAGATSFPPLSPLVPSVAFEYR